MSFAQEEHADTRLANTAADRVRQLAVQHSLLERKLRAVLAAGLHELFREGLLVDADAHRGQLKRDVEHGVVDDDVGIQRPVVVVGRAAVMRLAVRELVTDLHEADGTLFPGDPVLALLGIAVRIHGLELAGRDEEDVMRQQLFNIVITDRHVLFRLAEHAVDVLHDSLEGIERAVFPADDLFPVPLVDVDRVDVVGLLIAPDGVHIRVEPFPDVEAVALQGIALPLREGLHDFGHVLLLIQHIEGDGPLDAVQVVVQAGRRVDEQGRGDAQQIQALHEQRLEEVLDFLDRDLRLMQRQLGLVTFGDVEFFHGDSSMKH